MNGDSNKLLAGVLKSIGRKYTAVGKPICWHYIKHGNCDGRCGYPEKRRHPDEKEREHILKKRWVY
jgi:hypothetical protein